MLISIPQKSNEKVMIRSMTSNKTEVDQDSDNVNDDDEGNCIDNIHIFVGRISYFNVPKINY